MEESLQLAVIDEKVGSVLSVDVGFAAKDAKIGDIWYHPIPHLNGCTPFKATNWLTIIYMNGSSYGELPETVT